MNPSSRIPIASSPEATVMPSAVPRNFLYTAIAYPTESGYCEHVVDPNPDPMVSTEEEVKVDAQTTDAIERGTHAANEGRVVSSEEVRKLIPQWISRFSTPTPR